MTMYGGTLREWTEAQSLYAYCKRCRHSAALDMLALLKRFGPDTLIDWITHQAVCSKCGAPSRDIEWTKGQDARPGRRLVDML